MARVRYLCTIRLGDLIGCRGTPENARYIDPGAVEAGSETAPTVGHTAPVETKIKVQITIRIEVPAKLAVLVISVLGSLIAKLIS